MLKISQEVKDALHYASGVRHIKFHYELLDKNEVKKDVNLEVISCSLVYNENQECKKTGKIRLKNDTQINWVSDLIKPIMSVKVKDTWVNFNLGIYVPLVPQESTDGKVEIVDVDLYDKMIFLKEDCLTERLYIPKEKYYNIVIKELFDPFPVIIDDCDLKMPIEREFEIGEKKIDIVNQLLTEMNFRKAEVNNDGIFICKKFEEPTVDNIDYIYRGDALSIVHPESTTLKNFYDVPNIFVCILSNSEMPEDMISKYVNDNSGNILSTVSRGRRIVKMLPPPDVIASQTELDGYVRRRAFEMSQVFETSEFSTALMPIHESNETLEIHKKGLDGVFIETGWRMELTSGGRMYHTVRRLNALY